VLKPDKPWERGEDGPWALPFSDGVWYDPQDSHYKMWYLGTDTCYAFSQDGLRWEKPQLDVVPGTNVVLQPRPRREDNATVWLDLAEKEPSRRYKMFIVHHSPSDEVLGNNSVLHLRFSSDGIHWSEPIWKSPLVRDRTTVFFNPFRNVWVDSIKLRPTVAAPPPYGRLPLVRSRAYREHKDVTAPWRTEEIVPWLGADKLDYNRNVGIDVEALSGQQLYNLDAVAYESLMLGMFSIFHGNGAGEGRRHHMNDVTLGYSRDGFHWHRPDRRPFLAVGQKRSDWNWTNVQSVGGCCLVVGDELRFYCSGRGHDANGRGPEILSTGLATLRRDGFASLDAGPDGGVVITRPIKFSGRHLFVNVDCPEGELRVDILRENVDNFRERREPIIEPFTQGRCIAVRANSTRHRVQWEAVEDLAPLAGQPVRLRFQLRNGRLYSFWVSPSSSGASNGYVAAGGPGFDGPTDSVQSQ
jgi:hypothetical protein